MKTRHGMVSYLLRRFWPCICYNQSDLSTCCTDLKISVEVYVLTRNLNLKSVFLKKSKAIFSVCDVITRKTTSSPRPYVSPEENVFFRRDIWPWGRGWRERCIDVKISSTSSSSCWNKISFCVDMTWWIYSSLILKNSGKGSWFIIQDEITIEYFWIYFIGYNIWYYSYVITHRISLWFLATCFMHEGLGCVTGPWFRFASPERTIKNRKKHMWYVLCFA